MLYLINENFTVAQKGDFVKTSELAGDFVYNTESEPLTTATMREIAIANDFKVKGKKVSEVKKDFDLNLMELDVPEKREMSESEKVSQIVKAGFEDDQDEDDILVSIVQAGVKFQKAIKMLKQAKIDLGLTISPDERWKKSNEIMEGEDFEAVEYEDVSKMAATISKGVPNTSEKQALAMIRKYCKANELDIPKKPKGGGVTFAVKAMAWIFNNLEEDAEEFESWLEDNDRSEKVIAKQLKNFAQLKTLVKTED